MARFALLQPSWRGLWLGLACALVAWLLSLTPPLRGLDDWLLDGCFCARGRRPTEAHIVLVGLDDAYLDGLKKPLPLLSPELAEVVRHLQEQDAAAIGIDLLIPENKSDLPEIERAGGEGDAHPLGEAILAAKNVVLPELRVGDHWAKPLAQWQAKALNPFTQEPTDLGFVNLTEDGDLVVRRQQLLVRDGAAAVPQFALALFARGRRAAIEWQDARQALRVERVGGERVLLDGDQMLRINFAGPPGSFEQRSFAEVLDAARAQRRQPEFTGAIVLIGLTATGQGDYHPTPYANPVLGRLFGGGPGLMAGMEFHAHIIATLADRAYITAPPWFLVLPLLLGAGGLLGCGATRFSLPWAVALVLVYLGACVALFHVAFAHGNAQVPLAGPLLLGLLVWPVAGVVRLGEVRARLPGHGARVPAAEAAPPAGQEEGAADLLPAVSADAAFSPPLVLIRYPAPVAIAYRRFLRQQEPRARLDMLFFAVEALLRYLVALGVCDLFHSLAVREQPDAELPGHKAFDCLRQPKAMQLGMWAELLRETARALAAREDRLIRELPEVCKPGGRLDSALLSPLIARRNDCSHPNGSIALTPEECPEVVLALRPLLEQALQEVRFVCRYPLGFVRPGVGTPTAAGLRRYALHSCLGAQIADAASAYALETAVALAAGVPFVAVPDGSRLLYLWPLLLQRVSSFTGRPTLYVFEQVPDRQRSFLTAVRVASVEARETWTEVLREEPALDHAWLRQRLRDLPATPAVPPDLRLPARLLPWRAGRLAGQALGGNRLLAAIAAGGFGTIYAAETAAGQRVAVKVIEAPLSQEQFRRFTREFEKLRQAGQHPGILRCYESGVSVSAGREYPWYSMEFAPGGDLAGRLQERRGAGGSGGLPWSEPALRAQIVAEFTAVAGAVAHLHRLGIVHRDLKPGNVLMTADGDLQLSDFGLVKSVTPTAASLLQGPSTSAGAVLGTPCYMAPEQAQGGEVGVTADVYALGILLAELALGDRPAPELSGAGGSTLSGCPGLSKLPRALRKFILRCTERRPEGRPADAGAVQEEFAALVAAGGDEAAERRESG